MSSWRFKVTFNLVLNAMAACLLLSLKRLAMHVKKRSLSSYNPLAGVFLRSSLSSSSSS